MSAAKKSKPCSTLDEARAAKPEAMGVFGRLAKLAGIGITRVGEGYGLKVNIESSPAEGVALPSVVRGVPVKVEVIGAIRKRA